MPRQRPALYGRKRHINPFAWQEAIDRHAPQPEANFIAIAGKVRLAFEKLRSGSADPAQFDRLASAFNVGLIRAERIDELAAQTMEKGMEALRRCDAIYNRHGHFGFTGPDLVVVADALELYEGILRLSTPGQMESALDEAARRMLLAAEPA